MKTICNLISVKLTRSKDEDYPWRLTTVTVDGGKEVLLFAYAEAALDLANSYLYEVDDPSWKPTKCRWIDQPTI